MPPKKGNRAKRPSAPHCLASGPYIGRLGYISRDFVPFSLGFSQPATCLTGKMAAATQPARAPI